MKWEVMGSVVTKANFYTVVEADSKKEAKEKAKVLVVDDTYDLDHPDRKYCPMSVSFSSLQCDKVEEKDYKSLAESREIMLIEQGKMITALREQVEELQDKLKAVADVVGSLSYCNLTNTPFFWREVEQELEDIRQEKESEEKINARLDKELLSMTMEINRKKEKTTVKKEVDGYFVALSSGKYKVVITKTVEVDSEEEAALLLRESKNYPGNS